MPAAKDREQLRSEELQEFPMTGPFGGIQSELPPTQIESLGFSDARNILFRKGTAYARPSFDILPALPSPANEPILAVPSFFNSDGVFVQCLITQTRLFQYISGTWQQITGPSFTVGTNYFAWDVLNYKLCFSEGLDNLFVWDGVSSSYTQIASAQPFQYIAEIGLHLFGINPGFPQRYYWSGEGDPTDWSSVSSGLNDNINSLGNINGIKKIGQYGFGFHHFGIVQIVPTGIGTDPFAFYTIVTHKPSVQAPWSLAGFTYQGQEFAAFLSDDNVYIFNGTGLTPIGDRPLDDKGRRFGARSRILADMCAATPGKVYGFVTTAINGQVFNAYWLVFPTISVWVYNFDEGNWSVFNYSNTINCLGTFVKRSTLRIMDLVGTIAGQSWSPATLAASTNLLAPGLAFGFNNGVVGLTDFTIPSEQPCSATSGKLIFGDRRHKHVIKKFRLSVLDQGAVTYSIQITNEEGYSQTQTFTLGNGSGDELNYIASFSISGLRFQYVVSWPANQLGAFTELAPLYDFSGEQRGGYIEN